MGSSLLFHNCGTASQVLFPDEAIPVQKVIDILQRAARDQRMTHKDRLRELGLFSMKKRLWPGLMTVCKYLMDRYREDSLDMQKDESQQTSQSKRGSEQIGKKKTHLLRMWSNVRLGCIERL